MIFSAAQIAHVALAAGFGNDVVTAVAVALAESGGDICAYNPQAAAGAPMGKGSCGLWQISLHAHPEFAAWDLYDPFINARAAFRLYQAAGHRFIPWPTYKNAAFVCFMPRAQAGVDEDNAAAVVA